MNKLKITVITVILTACAAASLAIQHRAQIRSRERGEFMRQQDVELARLSTENEGLSNLVIQVKNSRPLSRDQLTELLRLRNEAGQLRQIGAQGAQLQATNAQLREKVSKAEQQLAEAQATPNYWPKDQLAYAGYADPASAMKSMLAAMNSGSLSSWRQSCTPEAIAQLEQEWKRNGLSETQQEAEMKAMADALISPASGFHILDQTMTSNNDAVINLSFDGEGKTRKFVMRKIGNDWKFQDLIIAGQDVPGSK